MLYPVEQPLALSKGDRLEITMAAVTTQNLIKWTVGVFNTHGREKTRYVHFTLKHSGGD